MQYILFSIKVVSVFVMERDFMGLNSKESLIVEDAAGGCKDSPALFRCPQVQWSLTNTFNPSNKWQLCENQPYLLSTNYPIQQYVCPENLPPHDAKALVGVNQGISLSMNNSFYQTQSAGAGQNFTAASTKPHYLGGVPITALYPNPSVSSQTATNEQWLDLKTSRAPAQMTIFYGGMVNVFDDISPDKAEAIMFLAGKGSSASYDVAPPRQQVVASSPKPVAENVFFGSQPLYTVPCSGLSSPISVSSQPMWQSGSGPTNNDGGNKISSGSTTPVNEAPRIATSVVQASGTTMIKSAVPQARKASLARFLEKRKERTMNSAPYNNLNKKSADCATPRSNGVCISESSNLARAPISMCNDRSN